MTKKLSQKPAAVRNRTRYAEDPTFREQCKEKVRKSREKRLLAGRERLEYNTELLKGKDLYHVKLKTWREQTAFFAFHEYLLGNEWLMTTAVVSNPEPVYGRDWCYETRFPKRIAQDWANNLREQYYDIEILSVEVK